MDYILAGLVLLLGAELLVSLCVHEGIELGLVGQLDLDYPIAKGILVDKLRLVLKGLIDLYHLSADRRVEVACCLDAFYGAELLTGFYFIVYIRHVDIDYIAKCALCIVGNTYCSDVSINLHKFMTLCVIESINNFCHN